MSAYVVDRKTICFLIRCGERFRSNVTLDGRRVDLYSASPADLNTAGNILWDENIKSVLYRYPDCTRADMPGPTIETFDLNDGHGVDDYYWPTATPVQALAALSCYEYQACEHPDWEKSQARAICETIRHDAIRALPGYDSSRVPEPESIGCVVSLSRLMAKAAAKPAPAQEQAPPAPPTAPRPYLNRDEAIKRIREGLKSRSGKSWSVTGGRGTAWGWIKIGVPPARQTWIQMPTGRKNEEGRDVYEWIPRPPDSTQSGHGSPAEYAELARLLGKEKQIHFQGENVPASSDYYQEYVDRAEGREPSVIGEPYWD